MKQFLANKFVISQNGTRYGEYQHRGFSPLLFVRDRYCAAARSHAKDGRFGLAFKFNAEICFAPFIATDVRNWKKLVFLCGLQAAMDNNLNQAAYWLAEGTTLQHSALVARCNTFGFPDEVRSWIWSNREKIGEPNWWLAQFQIHHSRPLFERMIIYISYMAFALGCTEDLSFILDRLTTDGVQDAKKVLLLRIPGKLNGGDRMFPPRVGQPAEMVEADSLTLLNITNRLFLATTKPGCLLEAHEASQIKDVQLRNRLESKNITAIFNALQLIIRAEYGAAKLALEPASDSSRDFITQLDQRSGPKKVFVGGFGWTGSSAVFDAFRGYAITKEMPGVGNADFINDGADSEPMIYQGPAGVEELSDDYAAKGAISSELWEKFFRLYILCDLNTTYFEYKTMHANRLLREMLGVNYYNIIAEFLRDYCAQQTTTEPPRVAKGPPKIKRSVDKFCAEFVVRFSERLVKALFDDDDIAIFNNAIGTNKVDVIRYIPGNVTYVSVNRGILDQMADQRQLNLFFTATAKQFVNSKKKKLDAYRKGVVSVTRVNNDHRFIDLFFEDWVKSSALREATARNLLGHYSGSEELMYFNPSVSQKNVGIHSGVLTSDEDKYLSAMRKKHSGL